jgi:hypothetical protein
MSSLSIHVGGGPAAAAAAKSPSSPHAQPQHKNKQQQQIMRQKSPPSASFSPQMMMMQRTQAWARKDAEGMCLMGHNLGDISSRSIDAAAAGAMMMMISFPHPQCNVCFEIIAEGGLCCGDAINNVLCAKNSFICDVCFNKFKYNSQLAFHLSFERERKLAELSRRTLVVDHDDLVVLSANAVAPSAAAAAGDHDDDDAGGANDDDGVLTTAQIAAKDKEQIVGLFNTCLAFLNKINNSLARRVTREDIFTMIRWDRQALKKDAKLRNAAKKAAAGEVVVVAEDDDDDYDEWFVSSDEEEEADKGVAHEGQLTNSAQVTQLMQSLEFGLNTNAHKQSVLMRANEDQVNVKKQQEVLNALQARLIARWRC